MKTLNKHYRFTKFNHNEIIAELEKQRIKKNLTKKDFSELAGYGHSTYTNWCSGNKRFSAKAFRVFANKYAPHLINQKTLFDIVKPSQEPKPKAEKQIVTTDPATGKLKVVSSEIRKEMSDIIRTDLNMSAVELFGRLILEGKI